MLIQKTSTEPKSSQQSKRVRQFYRNCLVGVSSEYKCLPVVTTCRRNVQTLIFEGKTRLANISNNNGIIEHDGA